MTAYWTKVLKEIWDIDASLTQLDGEYDLNFLLSGESQGVLKVMRADCDSSFIDMQCRAFQHLSDNAAAVPVPSVLATSAGELYTTVSGPEGEPRIVWLLEKMPGRTYGQFLPQSLDLIHHLGQSVGVMDKALQGFKHPSLQRQFKWDLTTAQWIGDEIAIFSEANKRQLITDILSQYQQIQSALQQLPQGAIHNDVNDYNILVSGSLTEAARVTGLIDLGDMCAGPRICNLAITAAYVVLGQDQPEQALESLVMGYHSEYPLTSTELEMLWPLLRMRLAVSVVISTLVSREKPDDPYVLISQGPAWQFLLDNKVNFELLGGRLRVACNLAVTDTATEIAAWLDSERGNFAPILGCDLATAAMRELSVEASTVPKNPFAMSAEEALVLGGAYDPAEGVWLGYYNEPRLVYTDAAFSKGPYKASSRRTVHIGVDAFAEAGRSVQTPLAATVVCTENRRANLDYGGMVILSHQTTAGDVFYTLYGHLDPESISSLSSGQALQSGETFAALGGMHANGGWNPHLHFQLALSTKGIGADWPGVADPDELALWNALCPNPAALMNLPDAKTGYKPVAKAAVLAQRRAHFAENVKLTYADPVMFLRGWRHHLFDEWGRPYLDSYNNVPHVGHAHPRIQAVAADQLLRMNSNTRYLHPAQTAFADKVLSKLPKSLSVCFFVNSGTEANELALRLARAHTGGKDMVTPDHGYHGNTTGAIDISAYKFNAKGGVGQADWVQLVDVADEYRGRFKADDPQRAEKYAALVDDALAAIDARGGKLAGFIAETFPSVGGQIIPPQGYLASVYKRIRAAGGVCIADEVQTALGRLGEYYFAFEQQQALPDIVVMGKPIGNGQPIGVLVTTPEIAASFAHGPEYFSTFGGSNLSCRVGTEVLQIVDDEGLQENARAMGNLLLNGLRQLQKKYSVIGDVRGYGLFIGVDLVTDRETREPATAVADYVKNRMREHRILMGTEGPADNILKIRPPLTIEEQDVQMILTLLEQVLAEAESLLAD
ncbi:MAG: aminotransferase class III-fold pyridoxal phosphate-dependent enzyme [Pseudomonadales bacterium]|nr:aminotransferase class III-fold pyridoxal phosphate-dependent enzyme [Pseudomonadales bacterium]NRA16953.1 aminotransferase class III-fold pyridoxal phosphate-dependent enzyme [Oceanospirillaceae bacterium]